MSRQDKIQQFLEMADPKILNRGANYFHAGHVENMEQNGNLVTAEVAGSEAEPYQVEIDLAENGEIESWYCDCPYDIGSVCKHTVAVLLSLRESENAPVIKKSARASAAAALQKSVEAADKKLLVQLILEHCKVDHHFQSQVLAELEDTGEQMFANIKKMVKASIRTNTYQDFIDWEGCDNICSDLDEALEQVEQRIQRGQYAKSLDVALYILLTAMELLEYADDSNGSLGNTIDYALETIRSISEGLAERGGERKAWVEMLLDAAQNALFNGWDDWRYSLLQSAAPLADAENEEAFYAALDRIGENLWERFNDSTRTSHWDRLTRYHVMCAAHGKDAARPYLKNNLDVTELRLILVQENMETGDYADAEHLCMEMVADELIRPWARPSQWQYLLYDIYRDWGKRDKQIEQAQNLALFGDKKFYQTAKALLTEDGRWEQEYPKFREALKESLSEDAYMDLLHREGEAALLMEQVQLHPREVFRYGATLAPQYGAEVSLLCSTIIQEESEHVSNRKEYQRLCAMIDSMAGFYAVAEARNLIDVFRQKYPRRSALLDELEKVERKIEKLR